LQDEILVDETARLRCPPSISIAFSWEEEECHVMHAIAASLEWPHLITRSNSGGAASMSRGSAAGGTIA
jgi:hypothetical protein